MRPVMRRRWWRRWLEPLRRRRRPLVRLWDAEFHYVSTIADAGRETWAEYRARLARAVLRPCESSRRVVHLSNGGTLTIDAPTGTVLDAAFNL